MQERFLDGLWMEERKRGKEKGEKGGGKNWVLRGERIGPNVGQNLRWRMKRSGGKGRVVKGTERREGGGRRGGILAGEIGKGGGRGRFGKGKSGLLMRRC